MCCPRPLSSLIGGWPRNEHLIHSSFCNWRNEAPSEAHYGENPVHDAAHAKAHRWGTHDCGMCAEARGRHLVYSFIILYLISLRQTLSLNLEFKFHQLGWQPVSSRSMLISIPSPSRRLQKPCWSWLLLGIPSHFLMLAELASPIQPSLQPRKHFWKENIFFSAFLFSIQNSLLITDQDYPDQKYNMFFLHFFICFMDSHLSLIRILIQR